MCASLKLRGEETSPRTACPGRSLTLLGAPTRGLRPRRVGIPRDAMATYYRFTEKFRDFPVTGNTFYRNAPRPPSGDRAGARGGRSDFPPGFSQDSLFTSPQASAATVSAQVSTFVRIASSEYEVRLTLLPPEGDHVDLPVRVVALQGRREGLVRRCPGPGCPHGLR